MRCRPWRTAARLGPRFRPRCFPRTWLLAAATLVALAPPHAAQTRQAKIQTLRTQRQSAVQQRRAVEQKLRTVKQRQRSAWQEFHVSEDRLGAAEAELRGIRCRQAACEAEIRDAKAELDQIDAELDQHVEELWQRLELFYKAGNVGYIEVVLGSEDFETFVDRTQFMHSIAENDLELKQAIEVRLDRQEALKAELEMRWRELASLREQAGEKAQQIRVETARKREMVVQAQRDRRLQEQAYQSLVDTQRQIDRMLRSLQPPMPTGGGGGPIQPLRGGFIRPVNGRQTSSFGWRIHPITRTRRFHDGVDWAAPAGTTIRAAAGGRVVMSGRNGAYGLCVMIQHSNGLVTLYGHCSALLVSNGQQVSQGQAIGRVGSTGWSTGPHLHFSVYRNRTAVNPLSF